MRKQAQSIAFSALLLAAPTLAAAQGDTAQKPKSERSCFRAQDIDGFNAVDKETVDVSVGVRDVYRLTLFAPSPDIDWTQRIGVESRGSSWICSGIDATIIVPGAIGVQRYPVTAIRKLAPEEIKARKAR
ncbi:DUF6491 family protein [Caulobacter segnis]|uniref:DUF6491 family protein n=1 Tax=Caulobacter segnis TaxID=88688 RepID=UPI002858D315|nr:DUF6491 family protein [Caulobacter segnis]MDR6624295.1 hypothetical protein [Caulobacter segnis]